MLNYRSFSQVILCGRLGQDAQLRSTKTGMKMLSFGVGTSVSAKGADGAYTQKTTWHDCRPHQGHNSLRAGLDFL